MQYKRKRKHRKRKLHKLELVYTTIKERKRLVGMIVFKEINLFNFIK